MLTPKVELHCHLDGSLTLAAYKRIMGLLGQELPTERAIARLLHAPEKTASLAEYLAYFPPAIALLQWEETLSIAAYELLRSAAAEGVVYIEIRFAPELFRKEGLRNEQAVCAVLQAMERAESDCSIQSRAILCMMRGHAAERNQSVLKTALDLRGHGVAGVDLAGNEPAYPPELYTELFRLARERDLPFTLHAGECGSAENVKTAVEMGAARIGHGIAIIQEPAIQALCAQRGVMLEVCPTSNVQTGAVESVARHPFFSLYQAGLPVSVNTDNRTVSHTSLTQEWAKLQSAFPALDAAAALDIARKSAEASFLPYPEKTRLLQVFSG